MTQSQFRYQPDEWAHDLDQWWAPLSDLAARSDCTADAWLGVLGVGEFFDRRLLEQTRVLTPWICLAATAVAASAAYKWAQLAAHHDPNSIADMDTWVLATTAFDLAVSLEELRWSGGTMGAGPLSTLELIDAGRTFLTTQGNAPGHDTQPIGVYLAAGWLAHSSSGVQALHRTPETPPAWQWQAEPRSAEAIAAVANAASRPNPLFWGTAHLAERLLCGLVDRRPQQRRPDDPPDKAQTNILLAAGRGQVGLFEARRRHSLLEVPEDTVVPDLARMAFLHGNADFLQSIATAFAAAAKVEFLERPGELISWNIQLPGGAHPLAERTISGRSAGLGAYVAFRSLSNPGVFADKDVAFTGQVSSDGQVGDVHRASEKIHAAHHGRIRLVVYPKGQIWYDPKIAVQLEEVETGEDAVIAAAPHLRGLRSYLDAACRLVAPEPWLRTWLRKQGRHEDDIPLLTVMCRHLPPGHQALPDRSGFLSHPGDASSPLDSAAHKEPDVSPCPAHLLPNNYPGYSFTIAADAGGGNTVAAKRMVAEAARRALDELRALGQDERTPGFTLPLYLPLGDLPANWDNLVQASVAALPALAEPGLEIAATLAAALRADALRGWQALVVVDGTDRTGRDNGDRGAGQERDFVALLTGRPSHGYPDWQPRQPPQVVLCGRNGSPAHHRAAEALRRERPDTTATMVLDPLGAQEIDRYVRSLSERPTSLTGKARDLAANPLFLTLSVIAGQPHTAGSSTDLLDRVIDVLLGEQSGHRRFLAEFAFRAAMVKGEPLGEFTLADIATSGSAAAVDAALTEGDTVRATAIALNRDERRSLQSAEQDTHLLTASGGGWRFFHDRAFAFLVADQIARHAMENQDSSDNDLFGELGPHLSDPLWQDVIEATSRLLELRGPTPT